MDRIPAWAFGVGVAVFAALAIWSATDENWAGLIVGALLALACAAALLQRSRVT